jgi:hypothetical protein
LRAVIAQLPSDPLSGLLALTEFWERSTIPTIVRTRCRVEGPRRLEAAGERDAARAEPSIERDDVAVGGRV